MGEVDLIDVAGSDVVFYAANGVSISFEIDVRTRFRGRFKGRFVTY